MVIIAVVLILLLLIGAYMVSRGTLTLDRLLLSLTFLLVLYLVFGGYGISVPRR